MTDKNLTPEECKKLIDSKMKIQNEIFYVNPLSGRKIKESGTVFSQLKKNCAKSVDIKDIKKVKNKKNSTKKPVSLDDCKNLKASKFTDNNEIFYINPLTKRKINGKSTTFMNIKKECDKLGDTIEIVQNNIYTDKDKIYKEWVLNPGINPFNKKNISLDNIYKPKSTYIDLYKKTYNYYKSLNKLNADKFPKNHYLFNGNFDILFIINDEKLQETEPEYYIFIKQMYNNLLKSSYNPNTFSNEIQNYMTALGYNNNDSKFLENVFCEILEQAFYCYFIFIEDVFTKNYKTFPHDDNLELCLTILQYLKGLKIFVNKHNLEIIFKEIFNEYKSNIPNQPLTNIFSRFHQKLRLKTQLNTLININRIETLINENDFDKYIDILITYYTELYNIFNYENAPNLSPFENLENKQFKIVEDPLIKFLDKYKDIDINNLELPKRLFKNDKDYNDKLEEYNVLKSKYEKDLEKWKNKNDNSTPPNRPKITLPNGQLLLIGQNFPKHIPDINYKKMESDFKKNQPLINEYKILLNTGFIELSKKDNKLKLKYSLLGKNRDYFKENILYNGSQNNLKCNDNKDIITQDDFSDDDYPLAKLQLIYMLPTKNDNGDVIRTDCFYAPSMYNYIVEKINKKEALINPITKVTITQKDIEELMSIMHIIDPKLEIPYYIKPINDKDFKIEHSEIIYNGHKYYKVFLSRILCGLRYEVKQICTILADVEPRESGSTDIASTVFLFNLYKLFNEGKLLYTYMPPYFIVHQENGARMKVYIKLFIHFNNYFTVNNWDKPREEQLRMFKMYLAELNNHL